ncbi:MAG: hypothetical protein JXQ71_08535 [Verrucomicrobia bacterium]|nr:hypothetical protein [Verrucomicrobiota bacterium]
MKTTYKQLLTGRSHHSAGMGNITEIASGAPGYSSVLPNSMSARSSVATTSQA